MIKVIDELPGNGKTLKMIQEINRKQRDNEINRWLFITPYLTETHRVAGTHYTINKNWDVIPKIRSEDFVYKDYEPLYNCVTSRFKHPYSTRKGGKSDSFLQLVINEQNIVATHSLYKLLSREIYRQLKSREYILVLDETLNVVEKFDGGGYTKRRVQELWDRPYIYKEEGTNIIRWREDQQDLQPIDTVAPVFKRLVDNGNLVTAGDNNNLILWTFPVDFLSCFKDVIILTHNWEGCMMQKYLQKYNVPTTIEVSKNRRQEEEEAFSLISVFDNDKMNSIGSETKWDLSHSDSDRLCKNGGIKTLKNNLINWFNNINPKQTKNDRAVTTFKSCEGFLRGNGYSKCFLPCNLRAVDCYKHKTTLAYCCNIFQDRNIKEFLNMTIEDEDLYSKNELIQWLFRFAVRDHKEVNLYIPSIRMREFLEDIKS